MKNLIKLSPILLSLNACNEDESETYARCYDNEQICFEDSLDATFYNKEEVLEFCDAISDINDEIRQDIYLTCIYVDNNNEDNECPTNVGFFGFNCDSNYKEQWLDQTFQNKGSKPNEEFCVLSGYPKVTCTDKY